ncbi:MAG: nicotinate (nicotinamide) nucleotide adenylyltransferase [Carboxylicivirga sp.]|nr:nicotinate (nicotinamide) nucleotide adenylyltransferase [Carboxylicivirga sp.]
MKKVGLFFGSFNPLHIGHLALANYMLEFENQDEIWFVVSPQNPFKRSEDLLQTDLRIEMVRLATNEQSSYRVEDIELGLPIPSYTIDTLQALKLKYNNCSFSIIMGADNILRINQWKSADEIINNHSILVYPRPGYPVNVNDLPVNCKLTEAPMVEIASSDIRKWIKEGRKLPYLLPQAVYRFIQSMGLYQ